MSSGSDGLYLSPLSDMSPATSDCLGPYFSAFFLLQYRVCVDFSGSFFFSLIFHIMYPFGVVSTCPRKAFASVGPVRMLEGTEQRSERFLM